VMRFVFCKFGLVVENVVACELLSNYRLVNPEFKFGIGSPDQYLRFEIFTTVTMKNGVFWDVTPCGSCKNASYS
jgi:hypothetical protein